MMRQRMSGRAPNSPRVCVASASPVRLRSTIRPSTGLSGVLKEAVGWRFAASGGVARASHGSDTRTAAARKGRSEEHTTELQSLKRNSYVVLCMQKKKHILNIYRL